MYVNLRKVLNEKGLSTRDVSSILGVAEKTAYNKIFGETDFTLTEARKVMVIFPEYTMDYIFKTDEAASV